MNRRLCICFTGNIFLSMNESPFLIKPYIKDMTNSELFAVMVAGFGTIAGSVLGSYLSFGVSKKKYSNSKLY